MSLRTDMLALEDELFSDLLSPAGLDQCPVQITIRTRTWSGGAVDVGTTSDSDLVLPQQYFVRQVTTREVEGSGGRYEVGDLVVSNITPYDPANPGVSFPRAQLAPTTTQEGIEIQYLVTDESKEATDVYVRAYLDDSQVYEWKLYLSRTRLTP